MVKISSLKVSTLSSLALFMTSASVAHAGNLNPPLPFEAQPVPPNAQSGQCYARVKIPAQYTHETQSVLVEDGYETLSVSQPRLEARQENILVKEASVRYKVKQPTYRTVTEQILKRPAYDRLSVSKPTFRTVTETVQVSGPRLVWKKGNPSRLASQGYVIHSTADPNYQVQGHNGAQTGGQHCGQICEIWCLVEEPGQTTNYQRKVLATPGQVRRTPVPASYQTVTKQVVSDPGGVEQIPVPAEYRSVTVEHLVDPGGQATQFVPPVYRDINKKVLVSPERYEWRTVVCRPGSGHIQGQIHNSSAITHGSTHYGSTSYGSAHPGASSYGAAQPSGVYSSESFPSQAYKDSVTQGSQIIQGGNVITQGGNIITQGGNIVSQGSHIIQGAQTVSGVGQNIGAITQSGLSLPGNISSPVSDLELPTPSASDVIRRRVRSPIRRRG